MKRFKEPLSFTHPAIAEEAHKWDPNTVTAGSNKKQEWICKKNHIWKAIVASRALTGTNCPYCSRNSILKGFNDLATTNPELASEAHGWDPTTVMANTGKKLKWRCNLNHVWEASGNHRLKDKGRGCPYCANYLVLTGFNDLATTHPELASEAHGWDARKILAGTNRSLEWKCSEGHVWKAVVHSRKSGKGCPVCSNNKVLKGFNDLATTHPQLAEEAFGWDPKNIITGSNKSLEWKCSEGHVWKSSPNTRTFQKSNCPVCSNQHVLKGFNDLATTHPQIAEEASGWDPTTTIAGSRKKLEWICKHGHKWKAVISSRKEGRGCPTCAKYGFDPNKKAYLYFLIQPIWEVYQIGITNVLEIRLNIHKRNNFQLIDVRGPMDGQTAKDLENSLLSFLKNVKADLSPEHIAGKFDGYSESWTIDSYKVNNLKELIDKASESGF